MNFNDIALIIYIILFFIGGIGSYKFATHMFRKIGVDRVFILVSVMINLVFCFLTISVWILYYVGLNELLLISGISLGVILSLFSQIILITTLFVKRKKLT
jgi:hypothetical protein